MGHLTVQNVYGVHLLLEVWLVDLQVSHASDIFPVSLAPQDTEPITTLDFLWVLGKVLGNDHGWLRAVRRPIEERL